VFEEPPKEPEAPSTTRGLSGFMLSINFSMGMVGGAGAGVLAAVLASGVFMGMPELGGRNLPGSFSEGTESAA
jgi:hypothetical protein